MRAATALHLTDADRTELHAAGAGDGALPGDVYALERQPDSPHHRIMKRGLNAGLRGGPHCDELAQRFLDGLFCFFPHEATRAGVHRYDALLPSPAPPARLAFTRWAHRLLGELASLDPARLSPDQRVDRRIMAQHLRLRLLHHTSRPRAQTAAEVAFDLADAVASLLEGKGSSSSPKELAARLLALPRVLLRDVAQDLRATGPLPQPLARAARRAAKGLARCLLEGPAAVAAAGRAEEEEEEGRKEVESLALYARAAALAAWVFARLLKASAAGGDGDGETTETETETETEEEEEEGGEKGEGARALLFQGGDGHPPLPPSPPSEFFAATAGFDPYDGSPLTPPPPEPEPEKGQQPPKRGRGGGGRQSKGETKGGKARMELGVGRERLGQYVALLYGEEGEGEEEEVDGQALLDDVLQRAEACVAVTVKELEAAALEVDPGGKRGGWRALVLGEMGEGGNGGGGGGEERLAQYLDGVTKARVLLLLLFLWVVICGTFDTHTHRASFCCGMGWFVDHRQ